jgi:hypothetical protein
MYYQMKLKLTKKQEEKFWNTLAFIDGHHWIWKKKKTVSRPTGTITINGVSIQPRKLAWYLETKELLKPKQLLISGCGNSACCNPNHCIITDRKALTSYSVKRGSENKNSKLNEELVRFIRDTDRDGHSLAKQLGVSQPLISQIRCGKIWKDVV